LNKDGVACIMTKTSWTPSFDQSCSLDGDSRLIILALGQCLTYKTLK
jgi:hypothetical protein